MPSGRPRSARDWDQVLAAVGSSPNPKWRKNKNLNALTRFLATVLWYPRSIGHAVYYTYRYSRVASHQSGKSLFRQLAEILRLAWKDRLPPELYYRYRFYSMNDQQSAREFMPSNVGSALFSLINKGDEDTLEDKLFIERRLKAKGLPVVETLAIVENDQWQWQADDLKVLPAASIVVKPNNGMLGQGFLHFAYVDSTRYQHQGRDLGRDQVLEKINTASRSGAQLVQLCLTNHKRMKALAPVAVSTIRVVTGRHVAGKIEPIGACLKVPGTGQITDHFAGGGYGVEVNLATGITGLGVGKELGSLPVATHEGTGVRIQGTTIPQWDEVLLAACKAHELLPDYAFLGWDIAVTDTGPKILEVNGTWGIELMQMPALTPLGLSPFARIAYEWLAE